ncbi:MAG: hypothetical protein QXN55_01550 [Candidatus Nitrosotenuis sp.]
MSTYVFEGTEVKKTGRIASRSKKRRSRGELQEMEMLVEVVPVDDPVWKKWVKESELFLIEQV